MENPTSALHVKIGISEDDLTDQFDRLEEELSLSETEKRATEAAVYELADSKIEKHGLKVSQEMRESIVNVLVSTFIQEEKQLDE
jgi:lysyl-tRNA synthetase class I